MSSKNKPTGQENVSKPNKETISREEAISWAMEAVNTPVEMAPQEARNSLQNLDVEDVLLEDERNNQSEAREILQHAINKEHRYSLMGLGVSLLSLVVGTMLCIRGITGAVSWTTRFLGLESELNDAAPGVVLMIIGFFIIVVTKPRIRLHKISRNKYKVE